MKRYTKESILSKVEIASKDMSLFYKQPFINYRDNTIDTDEPCTEMIIEWLLSRLELLEQIQQITLKSNYLTKSHDGVPPTEGSNRDEELIAMALFRQGEFKSIGHIVDYQTPLKNKSRDKAGKIDLLTYDGNQIRILELKEPDSKETMLRCVLEGYTYMKTVDSKKLKSDFGFSESAFISSHPLVFAGGMQHKEIAENKPNLNRLIDELGTTPFLIKKLDDKYIIMED